MEQKVNKARDAAEKSADPTQLTMSPNEGRGGSDASPVPLENTSIRQPGATAEQFPTNAFASNDKRDAKEVAKLELVGLGAERNLGDGVTPFGQAQLTDEDIKWLQSKKEKEAYANFQQWFATNFDKMSPAEKQYAREAFPSFYQERVKQLGRSVDLQRRIAEIKLLGIRSREDMLLQWAIEAGYVDADPLENILHPEEANAVSDRKARQDRFQRGLFNPKARGRGDWGMFLRQGNSDDIMGQKPSAAPQMGVGGNPFTVFGNISADDESNAGTAQLFKGILTGDNGFLNAIN